MFDNKYYWYVLFARTGAETLLVDRLKEKLDNNYFQPFIPQKTCIFRRKGQKSLFNKICFPGYVFIESIEPEKDFIHDAFPIVYKIREAYRFLYYGDKSKIAMKEKEMEILNKIFGINHCIEMSTGFKEGDSIRVISGALIGYESKILKFSRNRQQAVIAVDMFGTTVQISVGLNIIERINNISLSLVMA